MVIGGARDGAGRKQGGKAAVVGCFGVSLGCIGGGFLCLIFEVYITIFWLCKGGQGVGGVWGVGGLWVLLRWPCLRRYCRCVGRCLRDAVVVFIGIGGKDGGALEGQC